MQKITTLFITIVFFNLSLKAQVKSEYNQKFTEGNFLILEENYPLALKNFMEAYAIDSTNSNINFKIGFCYLQSETEKSKAITYLERAASNTSKSYNDLEPTEKSAPINAYYYYGQALHHIYKFDEAIANYEKFKTYLKEKNSDLIKDVEHQIQISNTAKELVSKPINVILTNLGDSINSSYPDYSPMLSADEKTIIFTSRRFGGTGFERTDDGQYYEDIYIAYKKADGTWNTPTSISSNINTNNHEASVGLTADAQTLLIYKDNNGGDIYFSTLNGSDWTVPEALGSDINSPKWETSACLSPDGNILYFVSDRDGGLGGRDIWKCVKLPNGKWSLAVNLGAPINTPYDEESPFIHPSGNLLYFSSKGHKTIGGFDIFFSTKNEEVTTWEIPQNIGYPINTTDDDVFYVTSPDGKRGYYSSPSQKKGFGAKDIYMSTLPENKEVPLALLKGVIIPVKGEQLPQHVDIFVKDNETGMIVGSYKPKRKDGSFIIIIPPGSSYTISYQNDGQEFSSETIEIPANTSYQEFDREIRLTAVTMAAIAKTDTKKGETSAEQKKKKQPESAIATKPKTVSHEQLATVDKLNFKMDFKYNVTEIDVTDTPFKQYIENLVELATKNGSININLTACASQVPTRLYNRSNKALAEARAEKGKEQLIEALKEKGIDSSKITFVKVKSFVGGPQYSIDYLINKAEYEKYQYLKIMAY